MPPSTTPPPTTTEPTMPPSSTPPPTTTEPALPPRSTPTAGAEAGDPGSGGPPAPVGKPPERAQNPVTEEGTRTEGQPVQKDSTAPTRDEPAAVSGEETSRRAGSAAHSNAGPADGGHEPDTQRGHGRPVAGEPGISAGSTSETATTTGGLGRPPSSAPGNPGSPENRSTTESTADADESPGRGATEPPGARHQPGPSNTDRPRRPPSPPAAGLDRMRQARSASDERQDGRQGTATERNPSRGRTDDDKGPDV
jgi:hypothetical protein